VQQSVAASSTSVPRAPSCLARIADSTLVPAVLYLHASELADLDSIARLRVNEIDLFTQAVATRFRSLLQAPPGVLPNGEPAMTWRTREYFLRVVVDRNGGFAVKDPVGSFEPPSVLGAEQRSHLLATALDSVRADGEFLVFAAGPADSVAFDLVLSPGAFGEYGRPTRPSVRLGFPVAALRMPVEDAVRVLDLPPPRYPMSQARQRFEATVVMQFMVDTTGRAEPATIRDVWPANVPPMPRYRKLAYDAFVDAVRASIQAATFDPARIGGCVVRQRVQQPFTFALRR
jgi:hypothetical protein